MRKLNEVKSEIITKQDQINELKIEQRVVEVKVKRQNRKLQNLLNFMDNHVVNVYFCSLIRFYDKISRLMRLLVRKDIIFRHQIF